MFTSPIGASILVGLNLILAATLGVVIGFGLSWVLHLPRSPRNLLSDILSAWAGFAVGGCTAIWMDTSYGLGPVVQYALFAGAVTGVGVKEFVRSYLSRRKHPRGT